MKIIISHHLENSCDGRFRKVSSLYENYKSEGISRNNLFHVLLTPEPGETWRKVHRNLLRRSLFFLKFQNRILCLLYHYCWCLFLTLKQHESRFGYKSIFVSCDAVSKIQYTLTLQFTCGRHSIPYYSWGTHYEYVAKIKVYLYFE